MMASHSTLLGGLGSPSQASDGKNSPNVHMAMSSDMLGFLETSADPEGAQHSFRSPTTAGLGRQADDDRYGTADLSGGVTRQPVADDPDVASFLACVKSISEKFVVLRKVGGGTFSTVYLANPKDKPDQLLALKHIVPTSSPRRTENELSFLHQLGGKHNIVPLLGCVREKDHVVLIMPFVPHERFTDYLLKLSVRDTSRYMAALFRSLALVHSKNVVHRDVKPSNFLHDTRSKTYRLVDFGLAHAVGEDPLLLTLNRPSKPAPPSTTSSRAAASTTSSSRAAASARRSSSRLASSPRKRPLPTAAAAAAAAGGTAPSSAAAATTATTDQHSVSLGKRKQAQPLPPAATATQAPAAREQRNDENTLTTASSAAAAAGRGTAAADAGAGGGSGVAVNGVTDRRGGGGTTTAKFGEPKRRRHHADAGHDAAHHHRQRSLSARGAGECSAATVPSRQPLPSGSRDVFSHAKSGLPAAAAAAPSTARLLRTYQGAGASTLATHSTGASAHSGPNATVSRSRSQSMVERALDSTSSVMIGKRKLSSLCPVGHKPTDVCAVCTRRPSQVVTRAGTPGFRAPEVLLKYPNQTTAVDIWAAGVIFLCLLSWRYPFFKGQDDMTALAQIVTIFGYEPCSEAFQSLGKQFIAMPTCPPCDLRNVCEKLRAVKTSKSSPSSASSAATTNLRRSPRKNGKSAALSGAATAAASYKPLASDSTMHSLRANFHIKVTSTPSVANASGAGAARATSRAQEQTTAVTSPPPPPHAGATSPPLKGATSPPPLPQQLQATRHSPRRQQRPPNGTAAAAAAAAAVVDGSAGKRHAVQVLLPPSASAVKAQRDKRATRDATTSSPAPAAATNVRRCPVCCQVLEDESDTLCWCNVPDSAYDLLRRCLDLNPLSRISAADAVLHSFIRLGGAEAGSEDKATEAGSEDTATEAGSEDTAAEVDAAAPPSDGSL